MNLLTTELIPTLSDFRLVRSDRSFTSKFDASSQTFGSPVGYWKAELKFENTRRSRAQPLIATLWGLRGSAGRFLLFDWSASQASGVGGTYSVLASQENLPGSVRLTGIEPGAMVAIAGDYVSVNGELKGVLNTVTGDHLGRATVIFEPWLRKPVIGGETVDFDEPTGVFKLPPGYEVPRRSSRKLVVEEITVQAVEAIDP